MGGPLAAGDIEDLCGEPVLRCPWHQYHISLKDGCKFSRPVVFDGSIPVPQAWAKSADCFQRVHKVKRDSDGNVLVQINPVVNPVSSDNYAHNARAASVLNKSRPAAIHSKRS